MTERLAATILITASAIWLARHAWRAVNAYAARHIAAHVDAALGPDSWEAHVEQAVALAMDGADPFLLTRVQIAALPEVGR